MEVPAAGGGGLPGLQVQHRVAAGELPVVRVPAVGPMTVGECPKCRFLVEHPEPDTHIDCPRCGLALYVPCYLDRPAGDVAHTRCNGIPSECRKGQDVTGAACTLYCGAAR